MKIKILLITFFVMTIGYSQKNIASIDVTIGAAQNGIGGTIDYNAFFDTSRKAYLQGGLLVTSSELKRDQYSIKYNLFTFSVNYFHQIIGNRNGGFKTYLGAGLTGGYEYVNNGKTELDNGAIIITSSAPVYGANIGIDSDIYLSDYFSFIIRLREYWHVYSDIGSLTFFAGAGLKYYFN